MHPHDPARELAHEMSRQREIEREAALSRIEEGDPPWQHTTGVVAAADAVRDLQFPLSKEELRQRAGERYIQATARLTLPIAEILEHMPEQGFASKAEFQRCVQKHWQGIRYLEVPEEQRSPKGGFQPSQRKGYPHHGGRSAQGLKHTKKRSKGASS